MDLTMFIKLNSYGMFSFETAQKRSQDRAGCMLHAYNGLYFLSSALLVALRIRFDT